MRALLEYSMWFKVASQPLDRDLLVAHVQGHTKAMSKVAHGLFLDYSVMNMS
jgi:hypothetical protein